MRKELRETKSTILHPTFGGGVPERPKGADCKSVGTAFGGSNPPPSTTAHVAQLVERFLGKDEVHGFESRRGLQTNIRAPSAERSDQLGSRPLRKVAILKFRNCKGELRQDEI